MSHFSFVGQFSLRRNEGGFVCIICQSVLLTTSGIKTHFNSHHLKCTTKDWNNASPPPLKVVSNACTKKRKRLTESETILLSTDSLTADEQTKSERIMLTKLGRWVPLVYRSGNHVHGVLTSSNSANILLQNNNGTWETTEPTITDAKKDSTVLNIADSDNL